MSEIVGIEEAIVQSPASARPVLRLRKTITHYWGEALVVAIALLVWLPRLSGPIDLRWDGGVYYLLGTSLAKGQGYRIPSEPGSPEALQYPPLLPAMIALYERALGTTDPAVVAPWLRKSYAALFVVYALAVLALARRYLRLGFAVAATALCLLQVMTIFLSDLLFADLPFAVVSVVFALVAGNGKAESRSWLGEVASFALAAAGFLFRTAGLALLAAWVLEAIVRKRWWPAIARGALALLPVVAWQAHVARVRGSYEYAHPAYEYQRAPYQYYNVSYAENLLLVDPFRPELGRLSPVAIVSRAVENVPSMLVAVGETVSTRKGYLLQLLNRSQEQLFRRLVISERVVFVPLLMFAALVVFGLIVVVRRRAWLIVFIILGSLGLTCTTPWPAQFARYLVGLTPFLAICALLGLSWIRSPLLGYGGNLRAAAARTVVIWFLILTFGVQIFPIAKLYQQRRSDARRIFAAGQGRTNPLLFYHDSSWDAWDETAEWMRIHARPDAIIATSAPHLLYLRTGLQAVLPPMEADPERMRRLLDGVPVSYVIVDRLAFLDISRRYARPAIESDPTHWRLVNWIDGTATYAHADSAE
jgi:hypothetical protein